MQEEFLGLVDSHPCALDASMERDFQFYDEAREIYPAVRNIVSRIVKATDQEHQRDIRYVLHFIANHNICVAKGQLIRREIGELVGYDVDKIPTTWSEGHLDDRVVAERRAELTKLLKNKKR